MARTRKTVADFPEVASQWHPTRNDDLTPEDVMSGSSKKYWWKCPKGPDHEWPATAKARTGRDKTGCPFCARQKPSVTNSLANLFPEIASEWHLEKNGDLRPEQVVAGSNKRCWWKCPVADDHEWQATPGNRTGNNRTGCPCCSGRQVCKANSLASLFPVIASEWHEKNGDLKPEQVVAGSNRQYWWKCPVADDHEWKATPSSRTGGNKTGCPCCAGKKPSVTNSLANLFPEIASEWHQARNGDIESDQVVAGTGKKFWWKCPKGPDHEWQATPVDRTGEKESGCPFCAGKKLSVTNSLEYLFPDIADQWHPTRNRGLKPKNVLAGTNKKFWWKCSHGPDHEWKAQVVSRTRRANQQGCPYCRGLKVSVTNSLASCFPEIAAQWHRKRNGRLKPDRVVAGTHKKYWWKCPNGPDHEWEASPNSRTRKDGRGCSFCVITPRSKVEIYIAFELSQFFKFEINNTKLKLGRRAPDVVDILIPQQKLAIEFDGFYWHQDKQEQDTQKTVALEKAGWRVIRIREKPLKKISRFDIRVPITGTPGKVKAVVDQLLPQIEKVCEITIPDKARYLRRKTLANKKAADAYIEELLAKKAAE